MAVVVVLSSRRQCDPTRARRNNPTCSRALDSPPPVLGEMRRPREQRGVRELLATEAGLWIFALEQRRASLRYGWPCSPPSQGSFFSLPDLDRLIEWTDRETGEDNPDRHNHRGGHASEACAER